MDLDTPSELLLTPSVSFSTSVSSSTSDVFSLLLTQLHQCHTQRVTELEQKVNHLIKKFQKLLVLSREQKESALKYRKVCQDLRKENHALKKALKEENRKYHKGCNSESSDELQFLLENQKKNGGKSPRKYSDKQDRVEPEKLSSSKISPGSSKLSRMKKKNRKVRYEEVSIPPKDEVKPASKLSSNGEGEPLFVPETIDPDLDLIHCADDESVGSSQNLSEMHSKVQTEKEQSLLEKEKEDADEKSGRIREGATNDGARAHDEEDTAAPSYCDMEETHLPSSESRRCKQNLKGEANEHEHSRSDVTPKDASTPLDKDRKMFSSHESPPMSMDGMTMSPVIMDDMSLDEDVEKSHQDAGWESQKMIDNSHTQMSPTFVGGRGLLSHSPSLTQSSALPSLPQDWTNKDKSVSRTFDGTGESEASFLLLQQNDSPVSKDVGSFETKKSPSKGNLLSRTLKRKVSPDKRLSKVPKVSFGTVSHPQKPSIVRQFTSHSDEKTLEEIKRLKRLKQSTLSQHMKPIADSKQKVTSSTDVRVNDFKIPNVPIKVRRDTSDLNTGRSGEFVDANVGISLSGSLDPIIDLDGYDGEVEPLEYFPSPVVKECDSYVEDTDFVNENTKKKTKESSSDKICSPAANESDDMFDDSSVQEDYGGKKVSFREPQDDLNERQLLASNFDRVPKKDESPQYKYKKVVRKHNEREQLKGFDCKQCAEFYNGMGLTDTQKQERMKVCSRHRGRYTPPSTPDHYWSIGFPDTPTCIKRGYIQEDENSKVDAEVMPRRRNKLKQLFADPKKE